MTEKCVRLMHDMYKASAMTVTRSDSASGEMCSTTPHHCRASNECSVGLHQALSTFLCAVVMDRLIYEVRQEFLWTAVFTDDVVISCESSEEEKESLRGGGML